MTPERAPGPVRLPVVGVMGSGTDPQEARAGPLGRLIAGLGAHLLTGAGRGAMESVSRAFFETRPRKGLVVGVTPASSSGFEPPPGYPNPYVELCIRTHLPLSGERGEEPLSRNSINVLTSDVLVFLGGSAGTASEARLAVRFARPAIAHVSSRGEIPGLPASIPLAPSIEEVERFLRTMARSARRSEAKSRHTAEYGS